MNDGDRWLRLTRRQWLELGGTAVAYSALAPACGLFAPASPTSSIAPESPAVGSAGVTVKRMPVDAATPKRGGILSIRETSIGTSDFDCLQNDADGPQCFQLQNIYNLVVRLDQYDPSVVHPELAESWKWSGDSLTLNLRKGVKWHDGRPFVAADVAYTFERMMNPKTGITSKRKAQFANVVSITTPDDSTVVVRFKQPQPDFLVDLGSPNMLVVPKHVAEPLDDKGEGMKRTIVGTGPFKLKKIQPDLSWEYERNPEYFKPGVPYLDGLRYTFIPDEDSAMAAYLSGQVHLPRNINVKANQERLAKDPGTNFVEFPANRLYSFVPLITKPPFNDIRVREALSLTLNRREWVQAAAPVLTFTLLGAGMMPGTPAALPTERLRKISGYDFDGSADADRAKAAELIKQAGYPGKLKFQMTTWTDDYALNGAIITAQILNKGPFEVTFQAFPFATFLDALNQGQVTAVPFSMGLKFVSIDGALGEACTATGPRNYGKYGLAQFNTATAVDGELSGIYSKQSAELDPAKRLQLVHDYQELWLKQFYQIHLAWSTLDVFWSKKVHNHWASIHDQETNYLEDRWLEQ